MATKYCGPSGSDSTGDGSNGNPYRSLQKLVNSLAPGDTGIAKDGTYTAALGSSQTNGSLQICVYLTGTVQNGTAANPITLKSENPRGAIITIPSVTGTTSGTSNNHGIRVARNYWIIEGFLITGGSSSGSVSSHCGISIPSGTNCTVRKNSLLSISRTVCSNSVFGNSGMLIQTAAINALIEKNTFGVIGRLRDGESGCSTTLFQNDHGIYAEASVNAIIRRNVFYDCNRGYPIHVYKSAGTTSGLKVYHNTIADGAPSTPPGSILVASTLQSSEIKNNLAYQPNLSLVNTFSLTASNTVVSYNLMTTNDVSGDNIFYPALPAGVTVSNNQDNQVIALGAPASRNYTLAAGSVAINAATDVGLGLHDVGAYQVPLFTSATVENGSADTVRVNFSVVDGPLLPATGVTGFSVKVNGNTATILSATCSGSTVLLQLSASVAQGATVTFSYSGGNVTDSADLGTSTKQPLVHTFTNQAVTNNVVNPNVAPAIPTGLTWRRL